MTASDPVKRPVRSEAAARRPGERIGAAMALSLVMGAALYAAFDNTGNTGNSGRTRAAIQAPAITTPLQGARFAEFGSSKASADARHVADWVADSRDNGDAEFIIVDKPAAKVYVFDLQARLQAETPVLLGAAIGDDSVPGIGTRPIANVLPQERTTPAGRFVAERGRNTDGEDVVWVDYDAAVSMHRVRNGNPQERRLARLATPTIDDNRISYGCINVPVAFYDSHISPIFKSRRAIVYVLPETRSVQQTFGSYDVASAYAQRVSALSSSSRSQ